MYRFVHKLSPIDTTTLDCEKQIRLGTTVLCEKNNEL